MRLYKILITGAVFGLAVAASPATALAQDGTLHKTGAAVHHTLKKSGNALKRDAKKVGSATHQTLRAAGNKTKTVAGNVTGISQGRRLGGRGRPEGEPCRKVGRAQHEGRGESSKAAVHHDLQKMGDSTKTAVKKPA